MKKNFFFQVKSYLLLFLLSLFSASAWATEPVTPDYVCFENTGTENATINFPYDNLLQWSTDKSNWTDYQYNGTAASLAASGKLYVRAKQAQDVASYDWRDYGFVMTGSGIKVSGNIMTLLDPAANTSTAFTSGSEYIFYRLFRGCTALTDASGLILPAQVLTKMCYAAMFENCTNLTSPPALPASTLAEYCYMYMFQGCTNLTSAPALQATTLAESCYQSMFAECTSLSNAPELSATTLATGCYKNMFYRCTNLNKITVGFSDWPTTGHNAATAFWVENVASTGTFISTNPSLDLTQTGTSRVPTGWNAQLELPGVCFEAVGEAATIKMQSGGDGAHSIKLEYFLVVKSDNETTGHQTSTSWSPFFEKVVGNDPTVNETVSLSPGDKLYVRATDDATNKRFEGDYANQDIRFVMTGNTTTGNVKASGNIMYMLKKNMV